MILAGAFAAAWVAAVTHSPWLGSFAGLATGVVLALVSGWFTIVRGADQVVVGTAVNLLSLGVTGTLYRLHFDPTKTILKVEKIPTLGEWLPGVKQSAPWLERLDAYIVLTLLLCFVLSWCLRKTAWGLVVRSAGEFPDAAEAAGFSVHKLRIGASVIGGALAGLAGAYLCLGIAGSFAENTTAGRGFVAIALVTFGQWRPGWVALGALLIGFLDGLQFRAQALGWKVPVQFLLAMPYVVSLLVLVFLGKRALAPASLGQPYRRSK
jgi:ABC-type uncharacterized transport system permease subunit